jgi:hypothetical protein
MNDTVRRSIRICGTLELILCVAAAVFVDRDRTFPVYLALYLGMAVPWLAASFLALSPALPSGSDSFVFGVALVMRVVFLLTDPVLSDDVYRYVWDGRVQHAGINPYLYPPEAPELALLRNEDFAGINNKDIPTIYPPLMQQAFFLATAVSESVVWMKAVFVLLDLALVLVLTRLLEALGLNPLRALVYAWSPLAVVEVGGSGHNDVLGALLLVGALLLLERRRSVAALLLVTGSGLAKLVGFLVLPFLARPLRPRLYLVVPVFCLLVSAPYAAAGGLAFRGLTEYALRWRGNDSLFHLLYWTTGSLDRAKVAAASLLILVVLLLLWRKTPPIRACFWALGALLLLTPTLHPWYLLWIAPLLAIIPSPAWMFLSASAALSYHAAYLAAPGQAWEELLWVKALEYGPFFVLLGLDLVRHEPRSTP